MKKIGCIFWYYKIQSKLDMVVLFVFFFFFTIITSLSVGTPAGYWLYRCFFLNICKLFGNLSIFHFQDLVQPGSCRCQFPRPGNPSDKVC